MHSQSLKCHISRMPSIMNPTEERVSQLVEDMVMLLCKKGLVYNETLKVVGVLGITVDTDRVFIVHVNEEMRGTNPSFDPHMLSSALLKRMSDSGSIVDLTNTSDSVNPTSSQIKVSANAPIVIASQKTGVGVSSGGGFMALVSPPSMPVVRGPQCVPPPRLQTPTAVRSATMVRSQLNNTVSFGGNIAIRDAAIRMKKQAKSLSKSANIDDDVMIIDADSVPAVAKTPSDKSGTQRIRSVEGKCGSISTTPTSTVSSTNSRHGSSSSSTLPSSSVQKKVSSVTNRGVQIIVEDEALLMAGNDSDNDGYRPEYSLRKVTTSDSYFEGEVEEVCDGEVQNTSMDEKVDESGIESPATSPAKRLLRSAESKTSGNRSETVHIVCEQPASKNVILQPSLKRSSPSSASDFGSSSLPKNVKTS